MTHIFQHIPRTAGTTLLSIVTEVYDKEDVFLYYEHRLTDLFYLQKAPKVIFGHLPFGIHKLLDDEFSYVAVMRNPIERIKSVVRHLNRSNILNVDEYLLNNSQNDMVKAFVYKPHTKNEEDYLEEAKENIKKYYNIGFTENFKSFVKKLGKQLKWPAFYFTVTNETSKDYVFTKEDTDKIIEKNLLDIKLYEWASKEFK
jgi:hypothetical protein